MKKKKTTTKRTKSRRLKVKELTATKASRRVRGGASAASIKAGPVNPCERSRRLGLVNPGNRTVRLGPVNPCE
jgi:hypothetical protein